MVKAMKLALGLIGLAAMGTGYYLLQIAQIQITVEERHEPIYEPVVAYVKFGLDQLFDWRDQPFKALAMTVGYLCIFVQILKTGHAGALKGWEACKWVGRSCSRLRQHYRESRAVALSGPSFESSDELFGQGLLPETMKPNSVLRKVTPCPYGLEVYAEGGPKDCYLGGCAVVLTKKGKYYLVGPLHVFKPAEERVNLKIRRAPTESLKEAAYVITAQSELIEMDIDFGAFRVNQSWVSKLGAKPIKKERLANTLSEFVAIDCPSPTGHEGSTGVLTRHTVPGFKIYQGSTKGGFSGRLYHVNGVPIGMHLGVYGKDNYGFAMNYLVALVERRSDAEEVTGEYLMELIRRGRRLKGRTTGPGEVMIELPWGKCLFLDIKEMPNELYNQLDFSGYGDHHGERCEESALSYHPGPYYRDVAPELQEPQEPNSGFPQGPGSASGRKRRSRQRRKKTTAESGAQNDPSLDLPQSNPRVPYTAVLASIGGMSDSERQLIQGALNGFAEVQLANTAGPSGGPPRN
jgi:hypothetical protein